MSQMELIEGTNRDVSLSQWFTPAALAERVVEWADIDTCYPAGHEPRAMRVLEPSAGNGALVRPLVAAGAEVYAIELDNRYSRELHDAGAHAIWWDNFLEFKPHEPDTASRAFDLCVMNPPYENGLDVAFILHALKFAPCVVGVFRSQILHGVERKEQLWKEVRPTRVAFCSRRPFKGAETDYVVLELVERSRHSMSSATGFAELTAEWW